MPPRTVVVKGQMLRKTDMVYDGLDAQARREVRDLIPGLTDLAGLATNMGTIEPTDTDRHHVNHDFLGTAGDAWFPASASKTEIMKAAFMKAIDESIRVEDEHDPAIGPVPKPISTYWINGAERFEIVVARLKQVVLILILTPRPNKPPVGPDHPHPPPANVFQDNLWLVASDQRIDEVRADHPPGYNLLDPEDLGIPGVKAQRLVGY